MPGWKGSTRRRRLPADWPQRRAAVFARDGHRCTWTENGQRCTGPAEECDHVVRGDDHGIDNLTSLCAYHHRRKSAREGNRARKNPPTLRRPAEPHPGLL